MALMVWGIKNIASSFRREARSNSTLNPHTIPATTGMWFGNGGGLCSQFRRMQIVYLANITMLERKVALITVFRSKDKKTLRGLKKMLEIMYWLVVLRKEIFHFWPTYSIDRHVCSRTVAPIVCFINIVWSGSKLKTFQNPREFETSNPSL